MSSLQQFDDLITSRSLLTHYFYEQKWNNGELTQEDLKIYAKEYYHLVKAVPGIVNRVRDRALSRGEDTAEIEKNVIEEQEHIELWERFASSLGVSIEELRAHKPHLKVRDAVCKLEQLAENSLEDGVAAIYALELNLPEIAETKKDGLCKYYDKKSEDAHIYFDEHLAEEEHLKVWRKLPVKEHVTYTAIDIALDAQHEILDGVCDACGITMDC